MRDMPLVKAEDWASIKNMVEDPQSLGQQIDSVNLLSHLDIMGFMTDSGLYLGLMVCGLFVAAAIYVRRYRDDS